MSIDRHAEQHGEITAKLEAMEKAVSKISNGKTVDLVVKGAVAVLGLLELQARTGIEIGTVQDAPAAIIRTVAAIIGGWG